MQTPAVNLEVGGYYAVVYDHTGPSIGFVGELLERVENAALSWSVFRELRGLSEDAPPFRVFDDRLLSVVLTGREAVTLVLDYVADAPEDEVLGLTAALRCVLSADALPAETVVAYARRGARERRRARAVHAALTLAFEAADDFCNAIDGLIDVAGDSWVAQVNEAFCFRSDLREVLDTLVD